MDNSRVPLRSKVPLPLPIVSKKTSRLCALLHNLIKGCHITHTITAYIYLDAEMITPTSKAGLKQRLDDDSDKSEIDEEEQQQEGDEVEDEGMEFRLFASDDTPTAIVLTAKEPESIYVHRERPPLEESPGSERMRQIAEAAIDTKTVLEQSNIPWVNISARISKLTSCDQFFIH